MAPRPKEYLPPLCGPQNQSSRPGHPNILWVSLPVSLKKHAGNKSCFQWLWKSYDIWAGRFWFLPDWGHFTIGVSLTKNKGAHAIKKRSKCFYYPQHSSCLPAQKHPHYQGGGKVKSGHQFQPLKWNTNNRGQIGEREEEEGWRRNSGSIPAPIFGVSWVQHWLPISQQYGFK